MHQSNNNAIFVVYPVKNPSLTTPMLLKYRRTIEDRLLFYNLDIDLEVAISWTVAERHHNDKRRLSGSARLCWSGHVTADGVTFCNGALQSGKVNDVPLIRTRDMRVPSCIEHQSLRDPNVVLNPAQRASQKGADATYSLLKNCIEGTSIGPDDLVVVVDVLPGCLGEWAHGALLLQQERDRSETSCLPWICYQGHTVSADICSGLMKDLQEVLLMVWWENHPDAGPVEPRFDTLSIVDKPVLNIASWVDGKTPVVPDSAKNTFNEASVLRLQWLKCVNMFESFCDSIAHIFTATPAPPDASTSLRQSIVSIAGPDFSVEPKPHEVITLDLTKLADNQWETKYKSQIAFRCKATKLLPEIVVLKDFSIWMCMDSTLSGDVLNLSPCELFGFNVGSWTIGKLDELLGNNKENLKNHLVFWIADDTTEIVLVTGEDNTKERLPLATHMFNVLKNDGVPDVSLQYHKILPLEIQDAGALKEVTFRYTLTVEDNTTAFVPKELGDDAITSEYIKRAAIGGCFIGHLHQLPNKHAKVTWEVQKSLAPPAMFNAVKPKLWLTDKVDLEKGYHYLLE